MGDHLSELAERRARLQLKSAAQRRLLGVQVSAFQGQASGLDRGLHGVRSVLSRPVLLAGGAALLYFFGPGRVLSLAGKAMLLLTTAKRAWSLFR